MPPGSPFEGCAQLWLTICSTIDCSPPGSSVHGIFQARILAAISYFTFEGYMILKFNLFIYLTKFYSILTYIRKVNMFKLVLEKAEEPEIKLPTSIGSMKKQVSFRKTSISVLLTMPKPLTVWITINCGKF